MYTRKEIVRQLEAMAAPRDRVVMLHSAYSKVGEIEGGPGGFLDILVEYFTAEGGLLCIPTHTWGLIGERKITLDLGDKYTNLGLISRLALERSDGIRSEHPTHSTVVFGERERALEYIKNEKTVDTPTSPDGCYGRLYSEGGAVLLLGVTHTSNTYLHAVDEILSIPYRLEQNYSQYSVRYPDGRTVKRKVYMFDESDGDISLRFDRYSPEFDVSNAQTHGQIGEAHAILCDAVGMKNAVEKIYAECGGKDPLS